jgi:WD repeat-containing protein 35
MTKTHIIVCSAEHVYVWQYKNQVSRLTTFETVGGGQGGARKLGRETAFFIEDNVTSGNIYDKDKYEKEGKATNDPICSVAATENVLIIGRASGSVHRFALPHIATEGKMFLKSRPYIMELNCDASKLAVIDTNGVLSFVELHQHGGGTVQEGEKNEVWQVKWSTDNRDHLVFMEKGRMNTMRGKEVEEPILTDGYICQFSDLQVKCILLDEIAKNPDAAFKAPELVVDYETKSLREARDVLAKDNGRSL